jgi:hypothetical protein
MQQSADKGRLLMVQTFIYSAVMYGAEVGHDEGGQRQDVSGRKESSPQHSAALHPRDCSSIVPGDTGYSTRCIPLMLLQTVLAATQNMEAGRWPKEACDSHSSVAGVGRPKVGTDWCGNVNH